MFDWANLQEALLTNWHVWFVSAVIVVMAVIDGIALKVPNYLTFPMIIAGWVYSFGFSEYAGWEGLMYSLLGTAVGLALLLPHYAIGGMGAGDVKMLAGIGAWMWVEVTLYSFAIGTIVGGVLAVAMVVISGTWHHHHNQFWMILNEIMTVKDPEKLAEIAADRKPTMRLLPYGIPICIGTLMYFGWAGLLV